MNESFREKAQILNEFVLKIAAMALMFCDHLGLFLLSYLGSNNVAGLILRAAGRLAFPLFAFMLAEGMRKTRSKGRYILRLTIMWALVAAAQVILFYGFHAKEIQTSYNAFADLILGALFIYCLSLQGWKKSLAALPVLAIGASYGLQICLFNEILSISSFPFFLLPGYSLFGFALILGFYYSKNLVDAISGKYLAGGGQSLEAFQETRSYQSLMNFMAVTALFVVTLIGWGLSYLPAPINFDVVTMQAVNAGTVGQTWCLLAAIFLFLYNGKRGPDGKAFRIVSYAFYPMHIAVLFLAFLLIFGY